MTNRSENELHVFEDGICQLQILMQEKPPGWDLKALWLAINLTFGNVETFVQSMLPVLHYRARYLRHHVTISKIGAE